MRSKIIINDIASFSFFRPDVAFESLASKRMPVKSRGELQMKKRLFLFLAVSGVCFCTQGADVKTAPAEALSAETPPPETEDDPGGGYSFR